MSRIPDSVGKVELVQYDYRLNPKVDSPPFAATAVPLQQWLVDSVHQPLGLRDNKKGERRRKNRR